MPYVVRLFDYVTYQSCELWGALKASYIIKHILYDCIRINSFLDNKTFENTMKINWTRVSLVCSSDAVWCCEAGRNVLPFLSCTTISILKWLLISLWAIPMRPFNSAPFHSEGADLALIANVFPQNSCAWICLLCVGEAEPLVQTTTTEISYLRLQRITDSLLGVMFIIMVLVLSYYVCCNTQSWEVVVYFCA